MSKNYSYIVSLFFILLFSYSISYSQTYGEIFTKNEADQKFGSVLESITMPTNTIQGLLNQTNAYIMFKIVNSKVIVLDKQRNVIYPAGATINSGDVFTLFSLSVVNRLLSRGSGTDIFIEQRSQVLSLTYGDYSMEFGAFCPPICD